MYAVIRTGGKQYRVAAGDVVQIERLPASEGDAVSFEPVLLVDASGVRSTPGQLSGTAVRGEIMSHGRGRKIRVFNYHAKTGWKKTRGHRQDLTTVRITEIG